tara:strand:+ start:2089 stop:2334 length:246 start_codon:yes stop_codon:yes gene_type:complete
MKYSFELVNLEGHIVDTKSPKNLKLKFAVNFLESVITQSLLFSKIKNKKEKKAYLEQIPLGKKIKISRSDLKTKMYVTRTE